MESESEPETPEPGHFPRAGAGSVRIVYSELDSESEPVCFTDPERDPSQTKIFPNPNIMLHETAADAIRETPNIVTILRNNYPYHCSIVVYVTNA